MNEVMKTILSRSSIRGFTDEPVTREERDLLIQAALASPTAVNRQFWHFSVVEDKKLINQIEALQVEIIMNGTDEKRKAVTKSRNMRTLYNAPLFVVISSKDGIGAVDAGIAVENIVLAAQSLGLSSTIIGGVDLIFDSPEYGPEYASLLQCPEGYRFMVGVVIGHKVAEKEPHELDYSK